MPQFKKTPTFRRARFSGYRTTSKMFRQTALSNARLATPISGVGQAVVIPRRGSRAEIKTVDTVLQMSFDTAGAVANCIPVNMSAQGNTINQRTGNCITLLDVQLSGQVVGGNNGFAANVVQGCRLVIFVDKQPNSTAATAATIFNTTDNSALYGFANKDRFKIIYDSRFVIAPQIAATAISNTNPTPIKPVTCMRKLKGIETVMNGAAGAITSCTTNALYVVALGDSAPSAGGNPVSNLQCRVRFIDP